MNFKGFFLLSLFSFQLLLSSFSQSGVVTWDHIKNFRPDEFNCTCGASGRDRMNLDFVRKLDIARDHAGIKFIIVSGYRTAAHNVEIGGVPVSSHVEGFAADIKCTDPVSRYKIIAALLHVGFDRIGIYPTHIHVDNDPKKPHPRIW